MNKQTQSRIFLVISFLIPVIVLIYDILWLEYDYVRVGMFIFSFLGISFILESLNIWIFNKWLNAREKRPGLISFLVGLAGASVLYGLLYLLLKGFSGAIMNN